jgi:hypothetical protein
VYAGNARMGVVIHDAAAATALREDLWRDRLAGGRGGGGGGVSVGEGGEVCGGGGGGGADREADSIGLVSGCRRWIHTGRRNAAVLQAWQRGEANGGGGKDGRKDGRKEGKRMKGWEEGGGDSSGTSSSSSSSWTSVGMVGQAVWLPTDILGTAPDGVRGGEGRRRGGKGDGEGGEKKACVDRAQAY